MTDTPAPAPEARHPLALENRSGANGMKAGDRVTYTIDGRRGTADEFMHDGEAFVSFDDGSNETVKWHYLRPEARNTEGDDLAARIEQATSVKLVPPPTKDMEWSFEQYLTTADRALIVSSLRARASVTDAERIRGEAPPAMLPFRGKIEQAIDKFAGETLARGHASSWHYGEFWKELRRALQSPAQDGMGSGNQQSTNMEK